MSNTHLVGGVNKRLQYLANVFRSSSVWHDCPFYSSDETCEWNFEENQETTDEHLVEEEFYCVQVQALNRLQIIVNSTEYCFEPSHIGNCLWFI